MGPLSAGSRYWPALSGGRLTPAQIMMLCAQSKDVTQNQTRIRTPPPPLLAPSRWVVVGATQKPKSLYIIISSRASSTSQYTHTPDTPFPTLGLMYRSDPPGEHHYCSCNSLRRGQTSR